MEGFNCKPDENDLYCQMFQVLASLSGQSKPSFRAVMIKLQSKFNCPDEEDNEEYEKFEKQANKIFQQYFKHTELLLPRKLKSCIYATYKKPISKSKLEITTILNKVFFNIENKTEIDDFVEGLEFAMPSIARGVIPPLNIPPPEEEKYRPEQDQDIDEDQRYYFDIIEKAVDEDDFKYIKAVPTVEIKDYIKKVLQLPLGAKNYEKEKLFEIIKNKRLPGSPRSRSPSPRRALEADSSVEDEIICNSRSFNKEQLAEYLEKVLGVRLTKKYTSYLKTTLCKMIQDAVRERRQERVERVERKQREPSPRRVERVERKIEEPEELEETERATKPCGEFERYNEEEQFYACEQDEFCDVDKKKCMKHGSSFPGNYKRYTVSHDDRTHKFYGTEERLKGLKRKLNQVREIQEVKESEEEQRRLEDERYLLEQAKQKAEQLRQERKELAQKRKEKEEKAKREEEKLQKERERREEEERERREQEERERREEERKRKEERQRRKQEEQEERERRERREEEERERREQEERQRREEERKRKEEEEREREEEEERKRKEKEDKQRRKQEERERKEQEKREREVEEERKRKEKEDKQRRKQEERQRIEREEEERNKKEEPVVEDEDNWYDNLTDANQYNPGLENILEQFEAKQVEKEIPQVVIPPPVIQEVVEEKKVEEVKVTKPVKQPDSKKLIVKKVEIRYTPEQKKKQEEEEKQKQIERERILEGKDEEEIFVEDIEPSVIPFDEVKRLLRNRLQEPAYAKVIGDKQFMNISKQISYCVGLSA